MPGLRRLPARQAAMRLLLAFQTPRLFCHKTSRSYYFAGALRSVLYWCSPSPAIAPKRRNGGLGCLSLSAKWGLNMGIRAVTAAAWRLRCRRLDPSCHGPGLLCSPRHHRPLTPAASQARARFCYYRHHVIHNNIHDQDDFLRQNEAHLTDASHQLSHLILLYLHVISLVFRQIMTMMTSKEPKCEHYVHAMRSIILTFHWYFHVIIGDCLFTLSKKSGCSHSSGSIIFKTRFKTIIMRDDF